MMASAETVLISKILERHGSRPDVRLWRNETAGAWVGEPAGRTRDGRMLLRATRLIQVGLCTGSSDLIGIGEGGRFVALEVKVPGSRTSRKRLRQQTDFIEIIRALGGIAGFVSSIADSDALLGPPPGR